LRDPKDLVISIHFVIFENHRTIIELIPDSFLYRTWFKNRELGKEAPWIWARRSRHRSNPTWISWVIQVGSKAMAVDAAENRFLKHVRYIHMLIHKW